MINGYLIKKGNYLLYKNRIHKVTEGDLSNYLTFACGSAPLLLNPSWLEFLKFEEVDRGYYLDLNEFTVLRGERQGDSLVFSVIQILPYLEIPKEIVLGRIRYVHDLQNYIEITSVFTVC